MKRGQGWDLNFLLMLWVIDRARQLLVGPHSSCTVDTMIVVTFLISVSHLLLLVFRNARDFWVATSGPCIDTGQCQGPLGLGCKPMGHVPPACGWRLSLIHLSSQGLSQASPRGSWWISAVDGTSHMAGKLLAILTPDQQHSPQVLLFSLFASSGSNFLLS